MKGGGRSSARETIGRVAPGAVAKKILKQFAGTEVCLISHDLMVELLVSFNFVGNDSRIIHKNSSWFSTAEMLVFCIWYPFQIKKYAKVEEGSLS